MLILFFQFRFNLLILVTSYEESPHFTLHKSHKLKKGISTPKNVPKKRGLTEGIKRLNVYDAGEDEIYDDVIDVQTFEKKHVFKSHNFFGAPFCDYCGNFMWGLLAQGLKCEGSFTDNYFFCLIRMISKSYFLTLDCGFNAHRKCSEKVPNDCCPDLKHIHRIFGIDLTTVVKACNTVRPFIIDICIKEIENRGLYVEGLYRESGLSDEVEALKVALERDWDKASHALKAYDDIHVITGVLKLYLRSLPIPLITFDAYPHFLTAMSMYPPDVLEQRNN